MTCRRRLAVGIAICCLALGTARALATDAKDQQSPPGLFDKLIADLSSDDWKTRDHAQQELARFGPAAAPRLKERLSGSNDPDLRTRLEGILKQIEEDAAGGPTFVTLHLKDAAPQDAFEELAKQAGAKLETEPPGLLRADDAPRVTIDADRQPFWDVMRRLCASCGVRPERSGGGKLALSADDGSWGRRPHVTSGPFLVTASELLVTRTVRFGADAKAPDPKAAANAVAPADGVRDHAQLQVEALFEPKLYAMSWSVGDVVEAADDAGHSLVLPRGAEPRRRAVYGGTRAGEWESTVWLGVPPRDRPGARLARVKFLSSFSVQTGVETLEVPNILTAKDVERVAGPARVVVKGVTRVGSDQYELAVASYPAGDVQAWRAVQAGQFRRGPRLLDANGRELMSGGGSSTMSATEYTSQLRFTGDPVGAAANLPREPARLVWDLPTGVRQVQVPVEFENLPLP